jgi:general secretion pathway protein K
VRERGAAILLALWAMLAMAALVAAIRVIGARDSTVAHARLEQVQLAGAADGMIRLTLLQLMSVAGSRPPVDGLAFPVAFGGFTGNVTVQDEAGKLDLNQAQKSLLVQVLRGQGLDLEAADGLSDKILDWREPGAGRRLNGAKAAEYQLAGYRYLPRNGPMESTDELRLVMGVPPALFAALAPALTVVSQNAWPDMQVAPEPVLRALPGLDEDKVATLLAARTQRLKLSQDGTVSDPAAPPSVGHAFTIEATITGRTVTMHRRAVVRLTGIPKAPLVIYRWQ